MVDAGGDGVHVSGEEEGAAAAGAGDGGGQVEATGVLAVFADEGVIGRVEEAGVVELGGEAVGGEEGVEEALGGGFVAGGGDGDGAGADEGLEEAAEVLAKGGEEAAGVLCGRRHGGMIAEPGELAGLAESGDRAALDGGPGPQVRGTGGTRGLA